MKTNLLLLLLLLVITTTTVSTTVVAKDSSSLVWYDEQRTTTTAVGGIDLLLPVVGRAEENEQGYRPQTMRNLQVKQPDVCFSNRQDCYCYK